MTETKKPSPSFPLYAGDVLADTGALSAAEMGILYRLTLNCWRLRVLPADHLRLARLAQVSPGELAAALPALVDHIYLDGDAYRSAAVEKALVEQAAFAEKQRQRATAGWTKRPRAKQQKPMPRHATAYHGLPRDAVGCRTMPLDAGSCPSDSDAAKDLATVVSKDTTGDAAHRAAPANKPVTGRQRPDVRAFLAHFASRYAAVVGTPYVPQGADGKQAAAILDALPDHADIKARLERFLTSDDPFIAQAARTVATFRACLNKPCILATAPEPVKSPEALWAVASACLSKYGSNRFQEAYEAAGEPVASIVRKAGGWKALGAATEFDARRLFLASVNGHAK